jgi:hypothetical protein
MSDMSFGEREGHPAPLELEAGIELSDSSRDLSWRPAALPDSSPPPSMALLSRGPGGGELFAVVRFPAGWRRERSGWYLVDEQVVVLEGELLIGDATAGEGEWIQIPAGALRGPSRTPDGALAVARFTGPPRWIAGDSSPGKEPIRVVAVQRLGATPTTLAVQERRRTWAAASAPSLVCERWCAIVGLRARRWIVVPAGSRLASAAEPVIAWEELPGGAGKDDGPA